MPFFTDTLAAIAAERQVYLAALVELDFPEGTRRMWEGTGLIEIDGYEWIGSGELGSISEVSFGQNDDADKVTFQLSGVSPEMVTLARQGDAVRGRDVTIYGQFLDVVTLQPLDAKWTIRQLIMDAVGYGAQGPSSRSISLTAETIWTARNLAAYAFWSDRDQQARFPGDRGCEFIPTLRNKRTAWPVFAWILASTSGLSLLSEMGIPIA